MRPRKVGPWVLRVALRLLGLSPRPRSTLGRDLLRVCYGRYRRPQMPGPRMTEAEENTLRALFSRFREEQPREFVALVLQTVLNRMDEDSIVALRKTDDEDKPEAVFVIFKGAAYVPYAVQMVADMKEKIEQEKDGLG